MLCGVDYVHEAPVKFEPQSHAHGYVAQRYLLIDFWMSYVSSFDKLSTLANDILRSDRWQTASKPTYNDVADPRRKISVASSSHREILLSNNEVAISGFCYCCSPVEELFSLASDHSTE